MIVERSLILTSICEVTFTTTSTLEFVRGLAPVLFPFQKNVKLVRVWVQARPKTVNAVAGMNSNIKLLTVSESPIKNIVGSVPEGFVSPVDVLVNVGTAFQVQFENLECCGFQIDNLLVTRSADALVGSVYEVVYAFEFLEKVIVQDTF